jgi:transcriptional regulator with XRE-family HTH domain
MTSAELLRKARREAGLTQAAVAARAGTTQTAIARMERHDANPRFATLERALRATGHTVELATRPRGGNVDETLIAANLRLTPAERLRRFSSWHESMRGMTESARRSRGAPS